MRCEKEREAAWGSLDEIGRLCQIVDDVLDYEQDIACGDTNCLTSIRRNLYLKQLISKFGSDETQRLFGNVRSALVIAIERARIKAGDLLSTKNTTQGMTDKSVQSQSAKASNIQ